jgi:hypothetical protein
MKLMFSSICAAAVFAAGCASTPDPNAPPRYGTSVQVVSYDSTPRPFNPDIQVFSNPNDVQGRPRHPIAQLVRVGWPNDQALIQNALIWRAKSLGADAIILLPPQYGGFEAIPFGPAGRQFSFQAEAFVWPNHIAVPGQNATPPSTAPTSAPPSAPPSH